MHEINPESVEDFIKSMEALGITVKYGEPLDLIWRLAKSANRELETLYIRIEELERLMGV